MKPTTKTEAPNTLLVGQERDCCNDDAGIPPGEQEETCVEGWDAKQKKAENKLKTAGALKEKAEKAYNNATEWEAKLEAWIDDAIKANKSLRDVCSELGRLMPIAARMEQNTGQTVKAIEALLCLVKKIFDDVRDVLKTSSSADDPNDPKGKLQELKQFIECYPKFDDKERQQALDSIAPYEKKMKDVYALAENVLNKVLDTFTAAAFLAAAMSGGEKKTGLKWQTEDLQGRFCGGGRSAHQKLEACGCPGEPPENPTGPPCGDDISLPTPPLLPIIDPQDPNKGSEYYRHLKELYGKATQDTAKYRKEMEEAKMASDAALARKKSLDAAIKAAQDAKGNK